MATRNAVTKSSIAERATKKATKTKSMPKAGKNPKGGLTAEGRAYFKKTEGSNLRPGVTGKADTPEKMMRKGSFLRRHFTHPRGPMQDDKGRPTRLALSAHAWGEPVPKDMAAAKKLADKGHKLLEKYHALQDKEPSKKSAAKKSAAKKSATTKAAARRPKSAKKSAAVGARGTKGPSNKAVKKTTAKKR